MRILLVEDEPLFRKGLARTIADSGAAWMVSGEAENGLEAEQLIAETEPDLVITDIRMPLMDGLELLKRSKERRPSLEFIVVTGFQDFQYAQTALRCGALDLLVKPCGKEEILEVLHKAEGRFTEGQAKRRKAENERQFLLENTARALILGLPYRTEAYEELRASYPEGSFLLFHIEDFGPIDKQYKPQDVPLLQFAVLNIIGELSEQSGICGILLQVEQGRFALISDRETDGPSFGQAVYRTIKRLLGLTVDFHPGGLFASLGELPDIYDTWIERGTAPSASAKDKGPPINRARQQVISDQAGIFLIAGQADALGRYLTQTIQEICHSHAENWRTEALSFSFALQDTARKHIEVMQDPGTLNERLESWQSCSSLQDAEAWMKGEAQRFMLAFQEWQSRFSASAVSRAIRYMEAHYQQSLSLQQVASQVHLNATYFSHLFKKETGQSFVNFLLGLRMEKAKQLLANTDLNVTEVSGMIGYDLPNYFAKLFKQYTGLSPKDFRKTVTGDSRG